MMKCLITGSTSGLGLETTKALAKLGYDLILIGRSKTKLDSLKTSLITEYNCVVDTYTCDLSLITEINQTAKKIKDKYTEIDVLINNAGGIFMDHEITKEGLEMTFALNHMSYFVLTNYLLDCVKKKIINVASEAHRGVVISNDFSNPKYFNGWRQYKKSKLANIYFTYHLDKILSKSNSAVTVNCLHPGVVNTNIANNNKNFFYKVISSFIKFFAISSKQGASTIISLASDSLFDEISGLYFIKSKPVKSSTISYDDDIAESLWTSSNEIWKTM